MKAFLKNKVVKNAGWLIGGKLGHKVLAFLVGLFTARYLGPSNYGLINYGTAYTAFFASLCTLGINSIIVKNFVDRPDEEGKTIGTTLMLRAVSSILSALLIIGIVMVVDRGESLTITVVALCSLGLIFQIFDTLNYWFQVRLWSKYSAIATLVSYTIVSLYKIILLIQGKDVRWFAIATSIEYFGIAVFLFVVYKQKNGPKFSVSMNKAKELLTSSSSFIVSGLMISIYGYTDKFMLKQMLDEASVGHYSLALSISTLWTFVLSAIIDSLYPSIMQNHNQDNAKYEKKNKQLYAIVFYASIFMSALISIVATPLIGILYGEAYLPASNPLRIVVWYTAFSYLGVARNAWIVCENKQKYLKYLYLGAAVTNVILNFVLIPQFGTSGAAAASLITQISTVLIFPAIIRDLRPNTKLMIDAILLKDVLPKR